MANFSIVGAGGYVAPRHLKAINDTGNVLVAATDPNDSVGVLDRYFPDCRFFTEIERFDRHLEKLRHKGDEHRVHYLSVCSPNYLHDAHVRLALRVRAHAICEKPLVINPWNIDALADIEEETGCKVYNVLQLRYHPAMLKLREQFKNDTAAGGKAEIELTYVTRRGPWYHISWKGSPERSGGVAMNIGIHFFDLLIWLFGDVEHSEVHLADADRMAGFLELNKARVKWFLSVNRNDLPAETIAAGQHAYRALMVGGEEIDLSTGFTDLHTKVYSEVLAGRGYGLADARPSIDVVYKIRNSELSHKASAHRLVGG